MARCAEGLLAAHASFALGDMNDASARAIDVLRWAKAGHNVIDHARADVLMGAVALASHDTRAAERHAREALATHAEHGNHLNLCDAIELLAAIAAECRDHVEAASLLGATATSRAQMGSPRGYFIDLVPGVLVTLRQSMGDDAFASARNAGAALDLAGLLAFIDRTRGARSRPSSGWSSLTPTELQVAELVRAGLTNREVAQRLIMATETVKSHVAHIFAKLGISRRAQLAALATERA